LRRKLLLRVQGNYLEATSIQADWEACQKGAIWAPFPAPPFELDKYRFDDLVRTRSRRYVSLDPSPMASIIRSD
jgi:hypothetical protein